MRKPKVFISYHSTDRAVAQGVASRLEEAGLRVCAPDTLAAAGGNFVSTIEKGVRRSDVFVVLIGKQPVTSEFGMLELGFMTSEQRSRGGTLVPVMLPGANDQEVPSYLKRFQVIDARRAKANDVAATIANQIAHIGATIPAA